MKIFLSYRRDDSAGLAGRMFDRLAARFGRSAIFMDVDSIPIGVDFREHLTAAVNQCDALLVIVGPQWAGHAANGSSRLSNPVDYVRIEIEVALTHNIPIIPVLIDRTSLPLAEDLPPAIRPLIYRNACHVDSGQDFHHHLDRLIRGLELLEGPSAPLASQELESIRKEHAESPDTASVSANQRGNFLVEIASGPEQGTLFVLTKERVVVGRHAECDIPLDVGAVSRHHAQFVRTPEGYSLEDLHSRNGTYINGDRAVGRVPLRNGDRIHVCEVILLCRCET